MGAKVGEHRKVPGPLGKLYLVRADNSLAKSTVSSEVVVAAGDGVKIFDKDGNEYLCFDAGVAVGSLGYGPKSQKLVWQAAKEVFLAGLTLYIGTDRINPWAVEAAELLQKITPIRGGKSRVCFECEGTSATDAAMKALFKRKFRGEKPWFSPNDLIFVYLSGAFHGRTLGVLTIMDKKKKERVEGYPMSCQYLELPFPDRKRAKSLISELLVFSNLDQLDRVGGIFTEIVQGEGGINVADKEAIQFLDKFCNRHDIPFVVDEIQSGFCRTGTFWAYEQYNIKPDIVLFGKAASGGLLPITGAIIREDLSFQELGEHSGTFGPDPILTAVLKRTILVMQKERLARRAKIMGEYFITRLRETFGRKPWLKEIRGLGLMIGMEFCHPKTKKPYPKFRDKVWRNAEKLGVLTLPAGVPWINPTLRFEPPLIVNRDEIEIAIEILERATKE